MTLSSPTSPVKPESRSSRISYGKHNFILKPGGIAAIVIVTPLEEMAAKILAETPGAEVILKRARPGHTVFHYRFTGDKPTAKPELTAFERGIYRRKQVLMRYDKLEYPMETAYGLPEFDSLSYDTEILLKALKGFNKKEIRRALVLNPGQGHVPAVLWQYFHPQASRYQTEICWRYYILNLTW